MYNLYKEGTQRETGLDVIKSNILAIRTLAEMLKTSLGPRGMDKMLISGESDIVITNDGVTIVKDMDIQHPAAKLVVEAAKAQDVQYGDGTTSAVVLSGFLAEQAEKLLDQKIHPVTIIEGYKKALNSALEIGKQIAMKIPPEDKKMLKEISYTSLSSKFFAESPSTIEKIINISIDAVHSVLEKRGTEYFIDTSNIKFVKKRGESVDDTELIMGFVLDKEIAHENMPRRLEDAKIAIVDFGLEIEKPEISAKMSFTSPEQIKEALEEQTRYVKSLVDSLEKLGAKVVISQKGMDDIALYFLSKKGMMGVKNVSRGDIEKLAKSVNAKIISSIKDATADDLGYAKLVEERKVGNSKVIVIQSDSSKAVTVLIRGSNDIVMDELERSFQDSINAIKNVINYPYIVGGGGSFEIEVAMRLREEAKKVGGKEQLAIEAFADALEEVATTLANTAGMDEIETLVQLRNLHSKGMKFAGIDVINGKVIEDVTKSEIVDPLAVKEGVLKSATEAVSAILKIDDYLAAAPVKQKQQGVGEGGYGGYT
ncbi:thermosome subunit [Sulfolobus sp. SCGC AB-777_L09]|nr:thermosome subunit [Sulfolobus sp. SCGC AB-777_L09]